MLFSGRADGNSVRGVPPGALGPRARAAAQVRRRARQREGRDSSLRVKGFSGAAAAHTDTCDVGTG